MKISEKHPFCYCNGHFKSLDKCTLALTDLGLQRGYGIFDFFRSRQGRILFLDRYYRRLQHSISDSGIHIKLSKERLLEIIQALQSKNNFKDSGFKIIITGGNATDCANYQDEYSLFVMNAPYTPPNKILYTHGATLITHQYTRPDADVKTLYYYKSVKLQKQLGEANAIDALYYDDYFSESTRSNIFFIKNRTVYTPKHHILKGITRDFVLEIIKDTYDVKITDIPKESLYEFDEVFITSTMKEVMPVTKIDQKAIGNGKVGSITTEIMTLFDQNVQQLLKSESAISLL